MRDDSGLRYVDSGPTKLHPSEISSVTSDAWLHKPFVRCNQKYVGPGQKKSVLQHVITT